MQHVPAADGVAVHHGDNGLGHHADKPLQVEHVQARDVVFAHVAAVAAHLLVAARAESLVFGSAVVVGAGEDDNPHTGIVARNRKGRGKLGGGKRGEGVAPLGPVDSYLGHAFGGFVDDFAVVAACLPLHTHEASPYSIAFKNLSSTSMYSCGFSR